MQEEERPQDKTTLVILIAQTGGSDISSTYVCVYGQGRRRMGMGLYRGERVRSVDRCSVVIRIRHHTTSFGY